MRDLDDTVGVAQADLDGAVLATEVDRAPARRQKTDAASSPTGGL
jgi:hypothetical protein